MRTFIYIVLGAILGFVVGAVAPVALFLFFWWTDPESMRYGGGTVFSLLPLVTAPAGAITGAVLGYQGAYPPSEYDGRDLRDLIAEFDEQFGHYPLDEQRRMLVQWLPRWLASYRHSMIARMTIMIGSALLLRGPLFAVLLSICVFKTVQKVVDTRSGIETIWIRWGDEVIGQLGPLPYSLRRLPFSQRSAQ